MRTDLATDHPHSRQCRRCFARVNGGGRGLFSFNSAGSCLHCKGQGVIYTDRAFIDDSITGCPQCQGSRFTPHVLRHTLRGKNAAEVLELSAEQMWHISPIRAPGSRAAPGGGGPWIICGVVAPLEGPPPRLSHCAESLTDRYLVSVHRKTTRHSCARCSRCGGGPRDCRAALVAVAACIARSLLPALVASSRRPSTRVLDHRKPLGRGGVGSPDCAGR